MLEDAKLLDNDLDSSANRSWGTTTVVQGMNYAAGLFWQPLQNKDDPYAEIEDSADSVLEGADLFALKPGKAVQYGLCTSVDGYKKGQPSIAVAIATALSDKSSYVAVFKVDNGWWYSCVRNDIILSDGDMLFLKEEDAKNQFMSMLAVPDWGRKIAPKEWGIEETDNTDIATLIGSGTLAKLQKIKALRGKKLYAVVGISAIVGFWLLSSLVTNVLLAPKKKPMVVAPIRPKVVKPVEAPVVLPWTKIKDPETILMSCYNDSMKLVKIMPPGWKINGINCSESSVTTSWNRQVGRIIWMDQALNESGINFSARSISDNGNTVIAGTSFKAAEINSPPAYRSVELKNILNDLFQSLDIRVTLSDFMYTPPEAKPQQVPKGQKPPAPRNYRMVKFSFSTVQNPSLWLDLLTKFSGLTITNIKYNTDNNIWQYEGAIYVL